MPTLVEIGLEPIEDDNSLVEFKGLEPLNETSFDPIKEAASAPKDTLHRVMGGLTTGALGSVEGIARWGQLITDAQNTVLDRVGLGAPSAAVSKGLGKVADVFGELKQDVQTYSESKRNRERDPLFSAQLAEAGGNFAGQIATAAVGKVPAIISNVGQMFQQEYGAAKEKGADDLTAYQAGVYNLPAAFLDYFTESKMVKSLIPQQAKRTIAEVTKKIFTNAGLEGATEVIQDEYSNWLAGNALKYDQERAVENRFSAANLPETGKQIAKTFAIGGILGGAATTAFEALQPAKVDEKGLAKEERLEALQKELDQINETQEKTQTSTAEFTPTISTNPSTATGDPAFASLPEVSRVRANVDPVFAEHVKTVRTLPEEERPAYLEKFNLTSDEVGLAETAQDTVTPDQSSLSLEKEPISQPEAITGIPSESDLKKIDVLKKATDVLKEDWESAPQIEVVADVSAIPDTALTPAEKDAIKGNVSPDGLFGKDGKVYIIGDKVPNIQRVKELVLHETKAHYGFKSLFGGDDVAYKRAMQTALDEFNARPKMADALAARRGGFKDLADLVKAYDHLNVEHKEGKYAITEELLSRASELYHDPTKPRPTWFNRIISRIKLALQPIMPGMKLNDQDIINLLGTKSTELLDAASKKVETGDADIPKFSLVADKKPAPAVHIGDQEFEGQKFPFFNLTEDIPGHPKNSTVSTDTLIAEGFGPPEGYSGEFKVSDFSKFSLTGNQEVDTILKDLNTTAAKLETKLFDDFNAIARVEKGLNLGKRLDASMSGWTAALQTRNLANVMKSVFTNGMIQYSPNSGMFETNQNSPAMRDIFNPLTSKGLLPTWENYAKALRAQTLVEQKLGKKWANVSDQEVENLTGFTKTDADKWIGEGVGHKEVTDAQDAYQKHNQAIRDFALETGLISDKQKDAMDQLLNYVPFFRQMDKEGNLVTSGRSGLARQKSGIKEFKGSKREILPVLESITAQTSRIIDAGMKNIAAQRAVGVMQAAGVAERLPTQTNPFTADVASVIKDVEDLGVDFSKLPKESQQSLAALLSTTTASQAKSTDPNVVTIRVNGKPQHYETKDPALAQALQSLSKPEESFLMKVIRGGKTLQTVTATTAPAFAMRNFMRDTLSTFVQSGDLGHPLRAFKGLVRALGNSQELRSIQAAGSGGSAYYNIDPKSINQVLEQDDFWKNRWNDKAWLGTLANAYKNILHAAENANRIAVYDKFIKKGATQAEAAFQAQDTLNFQMRGASKSIQLLANAVPFLNARMQGLYKIGRSYEDDPKGVALRGGMLLLGTMGLWALNHFDREDEDENGMNWYERLPDADKLLYWNFKLPFTKTIARIPKPFEIGTMFATIPELMLDALNDPKELRRSLRLGGQATAQAVPFFGDAVAGFLDKGDLSQAILQSLVGNPLFKIPVELAANKNLFFNRPIVPESKKRLPKEFQYNESTSATAKAAGNILGVSPMKADYLMNAVLSGLTPYVTFVTDSIAKSTGVDGAPNKRTVDYLGAGWVSRNAETMGNRYIQDFYQLKQDVDETYFAVRQMFLEQKHDEATAFLKNNEKKISMRGTLDAAQKQLKAYTNQLIAIRGDEDLSDEQRKKKEDEIFKQRNALLSRTLKQFNK